MKLKTILATPVVFLWAATSIFAAIPPAERLLPSDTLLMFSVPDWSAVHAASQQSPEWLLWNDPAMKPFRDDFVGKWDQKFLAPLEQSLGIKVSDYMPLLQGQITFALTQNGWDGSSKAVGPAMLLLVDTKDKSDLLTKNLAALNQQWIHTGKPVQTEDLQGIKFSVVTLSTNASLPFAPASKGNNASPNVLYVGQYQSLLIVGTSVKAVESVASHLTGGSNPALSANAQFAEDNISQFHDAPLYYGWFNAKGLFSVLSQPQPDDADSQQFSWSKVLLASGLQGLRSVSFTYRESRAGAQVEIFANEPESTRDGIFKIISSEPKQANPPPFVPADAVKFWRWRMDGQKSWAELTKTLTAISPGILSSVNAFFEMANATAQQQDPNFDIRKDLIGNLGDDWMRYEKAPSNATFQNLNSGPWLFLFAANNPDAAVLSLKTLAGMSSQGATPQSRDFLGRKIYTITLPSRGRAGAPASIYLSASGGYVAVSMDVSMMEGYLRSNDGKTKPLGQTPGLADAAEHIGGMGNGLFGYQNQRETARALFSALKNDPTAGSAMLSPLAMLPFASKAGIGDMMNFSLLPDYDRVSKYFGITVYGNEVTSEGLDYKFFTPRPPELN